MSLRISIENYPECDSPVQVEQEIDESCCRSYDVCLSMSGLLRSLVREETASTDNDHT